MDKRSIKNFIEPSWKSHSLVVSNVFVGCYGENETNNSKDRCKDVYKRQVHDCPQCKTHLRFHSGKLVLSKVAPETRENVIQAKEEVRKSKEGYQRWLKHKTLTEQLEGVEGLEEVETLSSETWFGSEVGLQRIFTR